MGRFLQEQLYRIGRYASVRGEDGLLLRLPSHGWRLWWLHHKSREERARRNIYGQACLVLGREVRKKAGLVAGHARKWSRWSFGLDMKFCWGFGLDVVIRSILNFRCDRF